MSCRFTIYTPFSGKAEEAVSSRNSLCSKRLFDFVTRGQGKAGFCTATLCSNLVCVQFSATFLADTVGALDQEIMAVSKSTTFSSIPTRGVVPPSVRRFRESIRQLDFRLQHVPGICRECCCAGLACYIRHDGKAVSNPCICRCAACRFSTVKHELR